MWVDVAVAAGSLAGLSVAFGLLIARVLGVISREISNLYEVEYWALWPPGRARDGESHL